MMKNILLASVFSALFLSGCQSGTPISYGSAVQNIQRHVTTEQQIRQMYGEPSSVYLNAATGTRTLVYRYRQSDEIKRPIAGMLGSIAGGALGYQVGDGSGQAIATMVGSMAGGAIAGNAVTTRNKTNTLIVDVSLATGRVINYQYAESGSRSQSWYPSAGVGSL